MPIFEFKCLKCGKKFEKIIFRPLNEVEIICPDCESLEVEKLISAPGSIGASESNNSCSTGCNCNPKF